MLQWGSSGTLTTRDEPASGSGGDYQTKHTANNDECLTRDVARVTMVPVNGIFDNQTDRNRQQPGMVDSDQRSCYNGVGRGSSGQQDAGVTRGWLTATARSGTMRGRRGVPAHPRQQRQQRQGSNDERHDQEGQEAHRRRAGHPERVPERGQRQLPSARMLSRRSLIAYLKSLLGLVL